MVLCYYVFLLGKTHHQPWVDGAFSEEVYIR